MSTRADEPLAAPIARVRLLRNPKPSCRRLAFVHQHQPVSPDGLAPTRIGYVRLLLGNGTKDRDVRGSLLGYRWSVLNDWAAMSPDERRELEQLSRSLTMSKCARMHSGYRD